jgi:DNA-binding transcriptional LysR family regulator
MSKRFMQSFDIVTLRVFLAVARLGSIGAAARNEHIAPSAASRRISDLEHDLDTVLFARTPAGASLTSAGKAFAGHCERLLSSYADVRADLKRFADGEAGELRLAAIPRALDGTLPFTIARFKENNPEVHVTIQETSSRQGIRFLREDVADLAIIYDSVDIKGFESFQFKQDPIWVVGKKDHPLFVKHSSSSPILFEDTLDFEHISYHEGSVLDELVSEARRKKGRSFSYDTKVNRTNSLLKCVEAGLGLGIISKRDLTPYLKNDNLHAVKLADAWATRNRVCVYPKGQAASPIVKKFLRYLAK